MREKYESSVVSLVSGILMLIRNREIFPELFENKGSFCIQPHARTAVGISPEKLLSL